MVLKPEDLSPRHLRSARSMCNLSLSAVVAAIFHLFGAPASSVAATSTNGISRPLAPAPSQVISPNADELAEEDEIYWARFLQQDLPSIPTVEPTAQPTANTPVPTSLEFTEPVIGFASIDQYGQNGTKGGSVEHGSKMVTVRNAEDFIYYIRRRDPYIVQVVGMLNTFNCSTCENRTVHVVRSNKTIIGVGSDSGIIGAGLKISGVKLGDNETIPSNGTELAGNIIIRNMNFVGCVQDCIEIQMFAHHVVIDHNNFSGPLDGSIDIKRGSDLITVSWNVFDKPNDKTLLLGHNDDNSEQDEGRLRVSYHHNWFKQTHSRHPRVRFGHPVHIFNNYYFNISDGYGIASTVNAGLTIEGNYFHNVRRPIINDLSPIPGRINERNNVYYESGDPLPSEVVMEPSKYYFYGLDDPRDVPSIVSEFAGVGKIA